MYVFIESDFTEEKYQKFYKAFRRGIITRAEFIDYSVQYAQNMTIKANLALEMIQQIEREDK